MAREVYFEELTASERPKPVAPERRRATPTALVSSPDEIPSVMPRKPTLSPTSLSAYLSCAVKYRYLYIDKIGRFYLRARPGYSFGSTLHQVLQTFHEEGAAQSREELTAQVEQKWISAGYQSSEQEQEFRAAGREIVQAYHAAAIERASLQVETVATEKPIRTDMGRFVLAGRVDRIDRHTDGALEVIDYKSGRLTTSPEEVAESLAMSIYQLILRRCNPGTRVFGTIYCLRSGETGSHEMTGEEAEQFEADIRVLGEEILDRDWEYALPRRIEECEECEFLRRCETYWRQEERRSGFD
jgi:putative RecB family exonuclease